MNHIIPRFIIDNPGLVTDNDSKERKKYEKRGTR